MSSKITCALLNCYHSNSCCNENGLRDAYCQIQSFCRRDPLWEVIVIPAVIAVFALLVIGVILYKLCTQNKRPMQVCNFAKQEIGTQKFLSNPTATRIVPTQTSIIQNIAS